jgi:hypothetical protein
MNTDTTTEKKASNFELNVIKLGVHTFQLQKGDRFQSNGALFNYVPSTAENKGKGKYYRWQGRQDVISAKKYMKDVLRADNIELIRDELSHVAANGKEFRIKVWEVKYAYKMELPKNENIVLLSIELSGKYGEEDQWKFHTEELSVKRVTAENYFLEKFNPIDFKSQIPKSSLNIVRANNNYHYYVLGLMDDYNDMEQALFQFAEKAIENKIQTGHNIVQKETKNLSKFQQLKSQQGY